MGLNAPNPEAVTQGLEVLQGRLAVPRVRRTIEDPPVGIPYLEPAVLLRRVEAVLVEIFQVGGLEDAHVDIPVDKDILHHPLGTVLLKKRLLPDVLRWAQVSVVVIEAADKPGTVLVRLVHQLLL